MSNVEQEEEAPSASSSSSSSLPLKENSNGSSLVTTAAAAAAAVETEAADNNDDIIIPCNETKVPTTTNTTTNTNSFTNISNNNRNESSSTRVLESTAAVGGKPGAGEDPVQVEDYSNAADAPDSSVITNVNNYENDDDEDIECTLVNKNNNTTSAHVVNIDDDDDDNNKCDSGAKSGNPNVDTAPVRETLANNNNIDCTSTTTSDNVVNQSATNSEKGEMMAMEPDAPVPKKTDVEKFGGKIVYNPDGSAYIIEEDELSDDDSLPLPKHEGSIVDRQGDTPNENISGFPQIANAVYITRSAAYYNALYGQAYAKLLREKMSAPDTPIVHSYRVYSLREGGEQRQARSDETSEQDRNLPNSSPVPVKPILMCFICKLSFGYAKSFEGHCASEHNLELTEEERKTLDAKNSSAIIQIVGSKDKQPQISFLEPVGGRGSQPIGCSSAQGIEAEMHQQQTETAATSSSSSVPPAPVRGNEREKSDDRDQDVEMASADHLQQQEDIAARPHQALSPNSIKGLLSAALSGSAQQQQRLQQEMAATLSRQSEMASRLPPGLQEELRGRMPDFAGLPSKLSPANLLESFGLPLALRGPLGQGPNPSGDSRSSPIPHVMMGSPSPMGIPSNANMLQGTTIGACPDHVNGRQAGVECQNCDLILNSSRMPGGLAWNQARNSCKTLKCPKCNWHYKYQETLEIHMKEKHPESETTCIYCITGQQHPRLARGETYTCGYKPYRCEVCNYSTTTKGNLSIHMQSDKHLNNMQELQNGGGLVQSPDSQRISQSPVGRGMPPNIANLAKQKPNWRCDVCNYETNVARNLRIHMTSEKHTHNIMVLQQNVKHMQQMSAQGGPPGAGGGPGGPMGFPGMLPMLPGMDPQQLFQMQMNNMNLPDKMPGQPEAAMADIAYFQALMMQMMTGGQFPGGPLPPGLNPPGGPDGDSGLNPDSLEPPPEPADPNPQFLFNCCVCRHFGSDGLEHLSQHLSQDRTKFREHEVSIVIAGNFICKLCSYKTNLKANFQLHCKTDKHLQRLNHVNHIKEGGPGNEWKLKFLNVTNPVQLRCNACDYYTNSLHKLQLHIANQRHEISTILFAHLKKSEANIPEDRRSYNCSLCKFTSPGKLHLMGHVRSMKHLQMEQIHQLQKRSEGNIEQTEIGDIFQVTEDKSGGQNSNQQQQLEEQQQQQLGEPPSAGEETAESGKWRGEDMMKVIS